MKVILIYDIAIVDSRDQARLRNVLKIARRYLHHIQRSVFEGELTESKLRRLETELLSVADMERDSIIIYTFADSVSFERKILTNVEDPTSNIF
ncbi:MAG: CRISPR-associated endonuclease Cas2 [bacterium]|nr:CRISPR-associated endonuclease Cas2 [bacterium]